MMSKKAQEEIVGFVLIVIIVSIVLVVFLGIIIRQDRPSSNLESRDIHQFLESTMQYTSNCAIGYEPNYLPLNDLIQECHKSLSTCTSGKDPCTVLESTLSEIIESSFHIALDASTKGYEFKSTYSSDSITEEIISLTKGNCSQTIKGSDLPMPAFPGTISSSFKLCS
jgi:hypothetical protein